MKFYLVILGFVDLKWMRLNTGKPVGFDDDHWLRKPSDDSLTREMPVET